MEIKKKTEVEYLFVNRCRSRIFSRVGSPVDFQKIFEIFVDLFFNSNKLIFRALPRHCFVSILVRRQKWISQNSAKGRQGVEFLREERPHPSAPKSAPDCDSRNFYNNLSISRGQKAWSFSMNKVKRLFSSFPLFKISSLMFVLRVITFKCVMLCCKV